MEASALRVMVVEDNFEFAEAIAELLRMMGHDVRCAHNGTSALASVDGFGPDLVVLDLRLPDLDGYQVCRELRRRPHGDRLTIVALSSLSSPEAIDRSIEVGFDRHLVKPFGASALLDLPNLIRPRPSRRS